MRQTVGLALVHFLGRPDEIFPGVRAAARPGDNMVQAAFGRVQQAARVLAAVAVALADIAGVELRSLFGHLRKIYGHNHRGHPDRTLNGLDGVIARADRQRDPLIPSDWANVARAFDVQGRGRIRRHLAEGVGGRANVDRLPVAVEHQNDAFVQYVAHKLLFGGNLVTSAATKEKFMRLLSVL